jgi:thiol-disulfide isomerase/thioredoxin
MRPSALLVPFLLFAACKKEEPDPPAAPSAPPATAPEPPPEPPQDRWYRVTLTATASLPFYLGLTGEGANEKAIIQNGDERIEAAVSHEARKLRVEFRIFGTWLELEEGKDGTLHGHRVVPHSPVKGQKVVGEIVAGPDPLHRFEEPARPPSEPRFDFSGTWRVELKNQGRAKAVFHQDERGVVQGTFLLATFGDLRYLAGRADGNELRLSTFDGQHAYLFRATGQGDRIRGEWTDFDAFAGGPFTGVRDAKAEIDLYGAAPKALKTKKVTIPALADPELAGKPVLVDLFGSWCPGCMDATPFLLELYRENHPKGLEMLSIAYEFRSPEENRKYVDRFIQHYAVPWKVIIVDTSDVKFFDSLPPELRGIEAWPTTIFLDKKHEVRAIHTGFAGPASGPDHERLKAEWREIVRGLLE